MKFLKEVPSIDFMRKRRWGFRISLLLIFISILAFTFRGKNSLGIDFTGGGLLNVYFSRSIPIERMREFLNSLNIEAGIQGYESGRGFIIRTRSQYIGKIKKELEKEFKDYSPDIREERKIGPVVGRLLRKQATLAFILALAGMLIYLGWRFEWVFGSSAVLTLFHDVIITVGISILAGRKISVPMLAAFLTIVGYSVNDTIVVFDRIRENMKIKRGEPLERIINLSINQTLSRTLLTSLTTLLAVLALYFLGSATIKDFSFAIAVGIVIGTYSSIFIASPLLLLWRKEKKRVGKRKR